MTSNLTVAGDGTGFFFEVCSLQDGILAKFVLDGQHGMLQGFFPFFRPLVGFFLFDFRLHIVKEAELDNGLFLIGQTVFVTSRVGKVIRS